MGLFWLIGLVTKIIFGPLTDCKWDNLCCIKDVLSGLLAPHSSHKCGNKINAKISWDKLICPYNSSALEQTWEHCGQLLDSRGLQP